MLIVALDTTGRNGSLAIVRYQKSLPEINGAVDSAAFETLEFVQLAGGNYSSDVIPLLSQALQNRGLSLNEVELFVVASGPGSFTGLRVGISAIKGLAEALQKPVAAVTVLEALALGSKRTGRLIAALDAQRNEVFMGEYNVGAAERKIELDVVTETLASVNDFTTWLSARMPVPITLTPDGSIAKQVVQSGSPVEEVPRPGADAYARIGFMRFVSGQCIPVDVLDANYIRRSDAEIFSAPKLKVPQV